MAHEMQSFEHMICERNVSLHTIVVGGVPWFRAKDVATALGYANPWQAVLHNVDEGDRAQLKDFKHLPGRGLLQRNEGAQTFISESGLYSLILASQKPMAKAFQRWITNEVLPSIRKTGQYTLDTGADMSKKRAELEMAEIDERIQTCKRRCNEEKQRCIEEHKASERRCIEDGLLSMQRLGLKLDDRDMMRAKDCINEITFGRLQDTPYDDEINIRTFLTEHGIRDPSMDCKLGKVGKRLYLDDHPDYEFQQKQILVGGQVVLANIWKKSMETYLERALKEIMAKVPTEPTKKAPANTLFSFFS